MDTAHLRMEYRQRKLERTSLAEDPFHQFEIWFHEALNADLLEPNAMVLATSSKIGRPSSRTVLMKKFGNDGVFFFTDRRSRKGCDLEENPYASVTFLWKELERQVHIQGQVVLASEADADTYFKSRPRGSQIAVHASHQGRPTPSRNFLEKEYARLKNSFAGREIPRPDYWVGFRLIPNFFEFWQGRPNRLHDRFIYTLNGTLWKIERVSP